MSELAQLLGDSRFVTLVGPGGAGKTRLAIEIGGTVRNLYPEGVWFVDLAAVSEPAQVVPAAAAAFGLAHERDTPMERTLVDFLAGKRALILLDNCEHIVTGAAALARSVLGATRSVALLATSREPLGLAGETVYKVGPLEIPGEVGAEPEHLAEIDSVRLFIDRASAADPGFRFTAEAGRIVADICHRLDGLPLAIELAARQLHVVGPSELHRSLLDQLDLLEAPGEPDARHRTMEAAIAWSYRLLDEAQRDVFVTLSAFPGSFTAQAVENVCRDAGLMTGRTSVPVLTALVSRSMVLRQRTDDGPRYRLLEPVRAFAAERAFEMGRTHALGRAHAAWTLELLEEDPQIGGAGERERRRWLSAERHHFPVALNWAIGEEPELALRLLVAAGEYVIMDEFLFTEADDLVRAVAAAQDVPRFLKAAALAHGAIGLSERFADYRSARSWAEEALRLSQGAGDARITAISNLALGVALRSAGDLEEARARIHDAITAFGSVGDQAWAALGRHWLSHVETARGNFDIVVQLCEEAVETWRQIGSDWGVARAWWVTAAAMALKGDYDQAESYAARSLELLEGYDDPEIPVHVRAVQGDAARLAGRHERAESIYLECLRDFQGIGDRRCTASTLKNLGSVALKLDRAQDASRLLIAALERRMRLADESGFPECYERLALVAERRGEPELAVALVGGASRLRSQTGATSPEVERAEIAALLSDLRTSLPDERFEVAWARGLELDPAGAVAETQRLLGV